MRDGAANTAGQAGSRREPRQTAGKTVSQAAPGCSLCLGNESRINLQDVGSHKSINKAVKSCQKTSWISSQPSRKKNTHTHTHTHWHLARAPSRGRMLGWISMVAASEARAASAPRTTHTRQPPCRKALWGNTEKSWGVAAVQILHDKQKEEGRNVANYPEIID